MIHCWTLVRCNPNECETLRRGIALTGDDFPFGQTPSTKQKETKTISMSETFRCVSSCVCEFLNLVV